MTYTDMEVIDLFSEYVLPENLEILVNHLIYEELAESIEYFTEIEGIIHFSVGGEGLIKVAKK